ncbi:MAG: hypothetical protein K0R71_1292 [Bacillales bacterium]|jgi:gas vesicle protein|nr:hypothetical protein [Bacillales bacterium]
MSSNQLLKGFITGVLLGGVGALLTAPASGKETRKKVKDYAENWEIHFEEIKQSIFELTENIIHTAGVTYEQLLPAIDEIKEAIVKWQEEIAPHRERITDKVEELQNAINGLEQAVSGLKK